MILLDTDIVIDVLREYSPALSQLESIGDEEIFLSGFVVMELLQGCRNKQEQSDVFKAPSHYIIEWSLPSVCNETLAVFAKTHLKSGAGILDVLIGQMAVSNNLVLYTFNEKHYKAIPNLRIVKPYKRSLQKHVT